MRPIIPRNAETDRLETAYTFWGDVVRYFVESAWLRRGGYRLQIQRKLGPLYSDSVSQVASLIDFRYPDPYFVCASADLHLRDQRARPK